MVYGEPEPTLLVSTDFGFIELGVKDGDIDQLGRLGSGILMPGTEHALLSPAQTEAYWSGNYEYANKDEIRHAGAFALRFAEPKSIVRSRHY